jgi:hypothetical protein
MGIHALEHLLFYAETYGDRYREKIEKQQVKPLEYQYPVCLAAITVSHFVVFELLKLNERQSMSFPLILFSLFFFLGHVSFFKFF